MATGSYTQTNNPNATYGESSQSVYALQQAINKQNAGQTGYVPIAEDYKYGDQTKGAYDALISQGYTYANGSFSKPNTTASNTSTTTTPPPDTTTPDLNIPDTTETDLQKKQSDLDKVNSDYDAEATRVQNVISNIQNGTTPLSAGEQAQVDSLKLAFQELIDQQKLTNIGAEGMGNIRGYQTGAAEYDPSFQVKTIGSIVTAGVKKVTDLNMKMASAVAQLTQSFKDNNISAIKSAWDMYSEASKHKAEALQKTIDDTNKAIKEARDAKQKVTDGINEVLLDAKKNGADAATVLAIQKSGSVSQALAAAGDYLQSATGDLGDYLQYKKDTKMKGLTPLDYGVWLDKQKDKESRRKANEAYNESYASAKGKAQAEFDISGSSESVGGKFQSTVEQVTSFEPALTQGSYKKQLQALIQNGDYKSAILKIQNSVSKALTGDLKSQFDSKISVLPAIDDLAAKLQAYSDAGGDTGLLKGTTEKIYNKLGEVKDPKFKALATDLRISLQRYRKDMSGAAFSVQEAADYESVNPSGNNKLDLNLAILQGMKENFQRQINSTIEGKAGEGARYISEFANAAQSVDAYVLANPDKAEQIEQAYSVPGATDADVLEYIYYLDNLQ